MISGHVNLYVFLSTAISQSLFLTSASVEQAYVLIFEFVFFFLPRLFCAGSHASFAMDDEPEPSAPPLELMDKVDGYEQASFDTGQ